MKILAISGSPRQKKTDYLIKSLLETQDNEYEFIKLSDLEIFPCLSCRHCIRKPFTCVQNDDMSSVKEKLVAADIIIFGSPTYFDNVSGQMKVFFDRCLGLYWAETLADKKAILISICGGNREDSAARSLLSMRFFCDLMKLKVIGQIAVIGGKERSAEKEIIALANKIKETNACPD